MFALALALLSTTPVGPLYAPKGIAIAGYDPVAYHQVDKATAGIAKHRVMHGDAWWYFVSERNRASFEASPEEFMPAYGGYCAYAMAQGNKVKVDPRAFVVHQGRLYLNFNAAVQRDWNKKRGEYIEKADQNWKRLETEQRE